MKEAECSREDSTTIFSYLKSMRETYDVLRWCREQFVNEKAYTFMKGILVWAVFSRIVSLAYPWLMGLGIDGLYLHNSHYAIGALVGIWLTYVIGSVFEWRTVRFIELTLGENQRTIERRINELFFSKNLGLHLEEGGLLTQENMEKGWNRLETVQNSILFGGVDSSLSLILSFGMLMILSPVCGMIIFFTLIGNFFLSLHLNRFVTQHMEPIESLFRKLHRKRGERWQGVERVITSGRELEEIEEMDQEHTIALNGNLEIWLYYIRGTIPRSLLVGCSVTLVGLYAGWCVWNNTMTVSDLIPILTWAGMASQQMRFLARTEREINWCTSSLKSLRHALSLQSQFTEPPQAEELDDACVEIEFKDLGHSYDHKRRGQTTIPVTVLSGLSFKIKPGQKVAFIGPSGAGKSTITRLIQRYMDPTEGSIVINGHDLRHISLRSWRRIIGYIPQQPKVFDGTLRDNLLYGLSAQQRLSISDEEILRIMTLLRVDFGSRLTHGLYTRVGRNGMKLSGGEAQRVMICAAILKRPKFMIIDEATSSLDAENQAAVQSGIDQLLAHEETSAIIIAHRLSTIKRCDLFVVLKPIDSLAPGESQIEYIGTNLEDVSKHSTIFKRLAQLEGIDLAA
ncbi:ABC transporter ATP-binding protein [Candidatus Uhrbacteria bacterium]|nr:ABC transporter ATP-binding protein [Candidatus Uhrbacteria bacterium]